MNNHLGKHFFKPTLLAVILFVLSCLTGQAQTKVWANIVAGYANTPVVKVTRVAMYEDRTELSMFIDLVKGRWIAISPNTVLKTEGKEYVVKKERFLQSDLFSFMAVSIAVWYLQCRRLFISW